MSNPVQVTIPPTTPPATPPTDPQTQPPAAPVSSPPTDLSAQIGLYERLMAEQQAEINRLRNQVATPAVPAAPAPTQKIDASDFFQDPSKTFDNLRQVILNDVRQTIEPLNEFRTQVQRQNIYTFNKAQLEQYVPQHLRGYWPIASQRMDMFASSGQLTDVSMQALMNLFYNIVGNMMAMGQTPSPTMPTQQTPGFVPPSIPPSPPPPPAPPQQLRALTENEKLVARAMGMDEATYLKMQEGSTISVPVQGGK